MVDKDIGMTWEEWLASSDKVLRPKSRKVEKTKRRGSRVSCIVVSSKKSELYCCE